MNQNDNMYGGNQYSYQNQQNGSQQNGNLSPVMTVGDWVKTMLLLVIPFANIIFLIVWATSNDPSNNINRRNWARAQFILIAISIVISIFMGIILAILGASLFNSIENSYYY